MVIFLQDIKDHHQCLITLKPVYMNLHTMLQDSSGYIYCQQRNKNATYCRVISITAITLWLFVKNKIIKIVITLNKTSKKVFSIL